MADNDNRTVRDAMMSQLLGEVDLILDKAEAIENKLQLTSKDLNTEFINNIDIFVNKSNEVLAAFIKKTSELKDTVEALNIEGQKEEDLVLEKIKKPNSHLFLIGLLGFSMGLAMGLLLFILL